MLGVGLSLTKSGRSSFDPLAPRINLSGATIAEDAAVGATIGTLSVSNVTGTPVFALVDNAGGKLSITGADLKVAAELDHETATSHSITVSVSGVTPSVPPRTFTIFVTNVVEDTTPDAFSFADVTNADRSTAYESNTITVAGIDGPASLSITGGEYSINGAAWASSNTTVNVGDQVKVRGTSSSSYSAAVNVVLTIGGVSDTYTITTGVEPAGDPPSDYFDLIGYGQSNWLGHVTTGSSPPAAAEDTWVWDNTSNVWAAPPAANGVRELLNGIKAATGKGVRLVYGGQSGVNLSALQKGGGTGYYEDLSARVVASGISPKYILIHHGEGDGNTANPFAATYQAGLDTLHGSLVGDAGLTRSQCKMIVSGLATVQGWSEPDSSWAEIQKALVTVNSTYPNIHYSHSNMDASLVDGVHWTAASYGRSGRRYARTVAILEAGSGPAPKWFATAAARVDGTHTDITVAHGMGTDFTPTTGITGFEISNNNGLSWAVPSGASRQDATTIRLTHSDLGSGQRLVRYQYGKAPNVSAPVLDNGPLTVPLNLTVASLVASGEAALPVPTHRISGGTTGTDVSQSRASVPIGDGSQEVLAIMAITGQGDGLLTALDLVPNTGSDIAASILRQNPLGSGPSVCLAQAVVPAGATSATLNLTFSETPWTSHVVHVWTVPTADLSSQTAVDTANGRATSVSSLSLDLTTLEGGLTVVAAVNLDYSGSTGTISGDETYVGRSNTSYSGAAHFAADASGTAEHTSGDNTVTATFTNAANMAIIAGHWR